MARKRKAKPGFCNSEVCKRAWENSHKVQRENGTGIFSITHEQHIINGKKALEYCRKNKVGCCHDPKLMAAAHKKSDLTNRKNGTGVYGMTKKQKSDGGRIGGYNAQKTLKRLGLGLYDNSNRVKGGKIGVEVNRKNGTNSFFDKKLQSTNGKNGGKITHILHPDLAKEIGDRCKINHIGVCGQTHEQCVAAGKAGAKTNKKNHTGFQGMTHKQHVEAGKRAAEANRKNGTNAFFNKKIQSEAGKIGGHKNKENHTGVCGLSLQQRRENRAKQILPLQDTKPEKKLQGMVKALNLIYFPHKRITDIEHSYPCDILIPVQPGIAKPIVCEADGMHWHNYPFGNEIDIIRNREMWAKGYKVLRLWENEIKAMELSDLQNLINKFQGEE